MSLPTAYKLTGPLFRGLSILALTLAGTTQAFALPSFARQTGDSCDACHVGSFGPQLTPHGMKFKLGGYTDSDGKEGHIPLAAMLIDTYTHTRKKQDEADLPKGFSANDNNAVQEVSAFLAGKLTEHVGSFAQLTYSGVDKRTSLDNTDVRYAKETTLFGQEGTFGISFNNNPSMQDPFNTLPAWRFPYTSSDLAPGPEAAPLLDDGVAGTVYGATAYGMLPNGFYAELGAYRTFSESFLNDINVEPGQKINGLAPYWRLAYYQDLRTRVWSVGLIGMSAKLVDYHSPGASDKYSDIGIDGHYQFLGNRKKIVSVDGSYIHESLSLDGSNPADPNATLNQLNLAGSYYYDKTYGATARYFNTTATGGDFDSKGWMLQADWTPFGKEESWNAPWANLRVGLQYTIYNTLKIDGDSVDGDANTLMAFVWLSM